MNRYYITPEEYAIAEKNGISRERVNNRVRSLGWDVEKAITTPVKNYSVWREWKGIAEKNGVRHKVFYSRIKKLGWIPLKAATTPVRKCDAGAMRHARKFRKGFFSEQELAIMRENGIKWDTAYKRVVRRLWDRERAISEPPLSLSDKNHPYRKKHDELVSYHIKRKEGRKRVQSQSSC